MKTTKFLVFIVTSLTLFSISSFAAKPNPNAPQGGNFTFNLEGEPGTIHPINSDGYATEVDSYIFDSLASRDVQTLEWKGRMADKWEISKDQKVFTFHLRPGLQFSDGKPVTAEDVKFSFDMVFDPKYEAAAFRPYFENFDKVEVVDPLTVKFYVKTNYFLNFDTAAGMSILPKHIYGDIEVSKKMSKTALGSGPYVVDKFLVGQKIILKKNKNWFGGGLPEFKGENNFETITFKFIKEENVALESIKKGEVDYLSGQIFTPDIYQTRTNTPPWGKTAIKHKAENSSPKIYSFIGFNFRNPIFQDKKVRLALAHLTNRAEMNKKFRYGLDELTRGPEAGNPDVMSDKVKPIPFDPKKAGELLKEAGWADPQNTGVLSKVINGKPTEFRFTVVYANKNKEKFYTLMKEDLKRAGIDMDIKLVEWNSFQKILDDAKFDMIAMSWVGTLFWDPKQIWHSSSIGKAGSNFIAYKNPEVDKLIDEARVEIDPKVRNPKLKKVFETIAEDVPYIFMINPKYDFYATTSRVQQPAESFKYSIGQGYWWIKP